MIPNLSDIKLWGYNYRAQYILRSRNSQITDAAIITAGRCFLEYMEYIVRT